MANFFSSLFGMPQRKPQSIAYQGIRSLKEIPETTPYTQELQRRMAQGPEYWRESFYNDIYEPTAKDVRGRWGEEVQEPIMSTAGAMGMARATPTIDRLAKELTKRELGLATFAGELKTKGTEFGKGISESARSGLGDYISREGNLQQRVGELDLGSSRENEAGIRDFNVRSEQAIPQAVGNVASTAGNIYGLLNPQKSYLDKLLERMGGEERTPYMGTSKSNAGTPKRRTFDKNFKDMGYIYR